MWTLRMRCIKSTDTLHTQKDLNEMVHLIEGQFFPTQDGNQRLPVSFCFVSKQQHTQNYRQILKFYPDSGGKWVQSQFSDCTHSLPVCTHSSLLTGCDHKHCLNQAKMWSELEYEDPRLSDLLLQQLLHVSTVWRVRTSTCLSGTCERYRHQHTGDLLGKVDMQWLFMHNVCVILTSLSFFSENKSPSSMFVLTNFHLNMCSHRL